MISKITEGRNNKASITFDKDGVNIKFSKNSTPKFIAKVAQIADEFMYQKDIEKDDFEKFASDSFEKSK